MFVAEIDARFVDWRERLSEYAFATSADVQELSHAEDTLWGRTANTWF